MRTAHRSHVLFEVKAKGKGRTPVSFSNSARETRCNHSTHQFQQACQRSVMRQAWARL